MKKFILCLLSVIVLVGCKKDDAKEEAVSIKKQ
jgi:hypothetical protein